MPEIPGDIAKLPRWAQSYIKHLEAQAQPNNDECRRLRQSMAHMEQQTRNCRARMNAMTEIFQSAARGGNETAQAYVDRIINEYTEES